VNVTGVSTTGIYCQSGCVARPRPENVTSYRSPVAAEAAGYRPCLRCRPDGDPLPDLGPTAPTPVVTALMLITDGFLDRHSEPKLAQRVGYSPRQLRRLFQEHIGATPTFIATSRRTHFARRLIDQTDLPMSQIARAAGFSGIRQFHRAMHSTFQFSPTALRAKRQVGNRPQLDGGLRLELSYRGKLDYPAMIDHLKARAVPGVEHVVGSTYRRVTSTCGYPGVLEVSQAETSDHLSLVAHLPTFDSLIDDVARTRRMFGLDSDITPAVEHLAKDKVLAGTIGKRPRLRVPGGWDRFETAVRIMVGQQVSVAGATTITGRIAAKFGDKVQLDDDELVGLFPSAVVLADADLEGIGMPGKRAHTISLFAKAVTDGEVDLHCQGEIEDVTPQFEELPGIGTWTAHMFALRVLGHPDAFPASDLGLRTAVGRLSGIERASTEETAAAAEQWRPHRSLAAQHLWTSLHPNR
jgi:AraC family transcriptional regulator of adaptative response / DNA-3-methyladenine glycosylase II